MLDIKELRKDPKTFEAMLKHKVPEVHLTPILDLDEKLRALKTSVEDLKSKKNKHSEAIAMAKRSGQDAQSLLSEMTHIGDTITQYDRELSSLQADLNARLDTLPNLYMSDVPVSPGKEGNECIKTWGEKPAFDFQPKSHVELNEKLKLFDFERGVKIAGSGWPLYVGNGARLEWALLNYMLDTQRKNGFTQVMPPLLANPKAMYGCAQLPKFEDQLFKIKDEDYNLYLIPTSECTLNWMYGDEILEEDQLPLKYCAYTPCFRREAGAAGRKEQGLIRTHQFNKVEMFCFTKPEDSAAMHQKMLESAEEVLQGLGIPYKNMLLSTGDMSFSAAKTIDIEAWLPGQGCYYEVSSVSNCTDFQARRSKIRYRPKNDKTQFVHTLNGSGLATSRVMVALLENNQQKDGSVLVPKVLHRYLEDITVLR